MGLTCLNISTKDLCKAIRPYFSDLHSLPYNFHSSEDTVWWLSLATEIPAYRFPKFAIFPPEPEAPDDLFVCLHVEKGVDETYARSVGLSKPHIIGPAWAWHGLLADMASNTSLNWQSYFCSRSSRRRDSSLLEAIIPRSFPNVRMI